MAEVWRIACDVQVGPRVIAHIERNAVFMGARTATVMVAVTAAQGEPDEEWFRRAMSAKCIAVVSPDRDLERLAYDAGVWWVRIRDGLRNETLAHSIVQRLRGLMSNRSATYWPHAVPRPR